MKRVFLLFILTFTFSCSVLISEEEKLITEMDKVVSGAILETANSATLVIDLLNKDGESLLIKNGDSVSIRFYNDSLDIKSDTVLVEDESTLGDILDRAKTLLSSENTAVTFGSMKSMTSDGNLFIAVQSGTGSPSI